MMYLKIPNGSVSNLVTISSKWNVSNPFNKTIYKGPKDFFKEKKRTDINPAKDYDITHIQSTKSNLLCEPSDTLRCLPLSEKYMLTKLVSWPSLHSQILNSKSK